MTDIYGLARALGSPSTCLNATRGAAGQRAGGGRKVSGLDGDHASAERRRIAVVGAGRPGFFALAQTGSAYYAALDAESRESTPAAAWASSPREFYFSLGSGC